MMNMGEKIRMHRLRRSMTQERLSQSVGVTAQAVSKWENDVSYPDIILLKPLARTFGISVDELLDDGQGPVTRLAEGKPDTDKMLLRIRVNGGGEGKEKVNINLPVKLIEILVSNDALMSKIGGGKSDWIKSVDFKQILTLISLGVTGKLVEVQGDEGETVEVWVE